MVRQGASLVVRQKKRLGLCTRKRQLGLCMVYNYVHHDIDWASWAIFTNRVNRCPTLVISHLHLLKPPLHRTFHQISQNLGSIFSLRFGSRLVVVVSSPSVVEECFTKNDIVSANRHQLIAGEYIDYNNTTVSASPLRRPVAQPPPPHVAQNLLHESTQHVLIVELKSKFSELSFNIIMRMIFGKRYYSEELENYEEAKQFRDLVSKTFEYDSASNPNDFLLVLRWIDYGNFDKNLGRIHKRMDALLQGLIDEHRSDKIRNSMIDHLLSLQESQPEY
ncbi:hypothetical protein HYC85_006043 [Camellia sinensis]|uniref:Uncharacterized protein n=1 Tax=Camellia sinensis TaxID=4442 RepID=A0A7J7I3U6_CAMSI|nr:hypothetical protein HYC85_006043 [Camellia sinensis]